MFYVFQDFVVLLVQYSIKGWNKVFQYMSETDIFKNIVLEEVKKSEIHLNDDVYKIDIVEISNRHKIQSLIIDYLPVFAINNPVNTYSIFYELLRSFFQTNNCTYDFLSHNIEHQEMLCFAITYMKYKKSLDISDKAIKNNVENEYITRYRTLWWRCELWNIYKSQIVQKKKYPKMYLDNSKLGLVCYLEDVKRTLSFEGKELSLEPDVNYLSDLENEVSPKKEIKKRKMGLYDYFCDDIDNSKYDFVIHKLMELTLGFVGKKISEVIRAAYEARIFRDLPSYDALKEAGFENFGAKSGYYNYIGLKLLRGEGKDKTLLWHEEIFEKCVELKNKCVHVYEKD